MFPFAPNSDHLWRGKEERTRGAAPTLNLTACAVPDRLTEFRSYDLGQCEGAYHTGCLTPPIEGVPDGEWFCPTCDVPHAGGLPDGEGDEEEEEEEEEEEVVPASRKRKAATGGKSLPLLGHGL